MTPVSCSARVLEFVPRRVIRMDRAVMLRGVTRDAQYVALAIMAALSVTTPFSLLSYSLAALALGIAALSSGTFRPQGADILLVGLVVLTALSSTWTVSPALTSVGVRSQIACASIFIAIRATVTATRGLWVVGLGYLVGCVISIRELLAQSGATLSLRYDLSGPRLGVSGLNPNYTAYALAGAAAVILLLSTVHRRAAPFLIVGGVLAYSALLLTGTRGGYIAILAVAGWAVWWRLFPRLRVASLRMLYGVIVIAAAGIFIGIGDKGLRLYALGEGDRDVGDLNGRLIVWPLAREAFDGHPMLGLGAGTFPTLNRDGIYAHNVLLDVAAGLGVGGLVLMTGFLYYAVVHETRQVSADRRTLLIGVLLCAATPPMLSGYWYLAPAFWVVLALFTRIHLLAPGGQDSASKSSGELASSAWQSTAQPP